MKTYLPRIIDKLLRERLEAKGAVLLEGPKWCGKTTSAKEIAGSFILMDQPEMSRQYQSMAELSPLQLLKGETPRLIDEWQIALIYGMQLDMRLTKGMSSANSF